MRAFHILYMHINLLLFLQLLSQNVGSDFVLAMDSIQSFRVSEYLPVSRHTPERWFSPRFGYTERLIIYGLLDCDMRAFHILYMHINLFLFLPLLSQNVGSDHVLAMDSIQNLRVS
jgi:hypothetical protein